MGVTILEVSSKVYHKASILPPEETKPSVCIPYIRCLSEPIKRIFSTVEVRFFLNRILHFNSSWYMSRTQSHLFRSQILYIAYLVKHTPRRISVRLVSNLELALVNIRQLSSMRIQSYQLLQSMCGHRWAEPVLSRKQEDRLQA